MSFEFNGATACFPSQLPRQHESRSHNDGWQDGPQNSFTAEIPSSLQKQRQVQALVMLSFGIEPRVALWTPTSVAHLF
jgi:hypothetical protein